MKRTRPEIVPATIVAELFIGWMKDKAALDPFATESEDEMPPTASLRNNRTRRTELLDELGPNGLPRVLAFLERAGVHDGARRCRAEIQRLRHELALSGQDTASSPAPKLTPSSSMVFAPQRGPLS